MDVDSASTAAPSPSLDPQVQGASLYLQSVQGGALRGLFETLKEIVHDVCLCFDETGVRLCTMDSAKCALVYLKLAASSFEVYHCPERVYAGLNMSNTFRLIRATGSHDTVVIKVMEETRDQLTLVIQNAEKSSVTSFSIKLLDVDAEDITIPNVDFDSIITMPSSYFQRLTRDMSNLAETCVITSKGGTLTLGCDGDYATQTTVIGENSDCLNFSAQSTKEISGRFSLKYLCLFARASSLCTTIELFMRENYPIVLVYRVANLGELRFCLAPKIDSN